MSSAPAATPVTTPLVGFTVASAALELLHNPPPVVLPKSVVQFEQTVAEPVVVATVGKAFTARIMF